MGMYTEKAFYEQARKMGKEIQLNPGGNDSINLFDMQQIDITPQYLDEMEKQLRALLEEANKYHMYGKQLAMETLTNTSLLDKQPVALKERAVSVLKEYAEQ